MLSLLTINIGAASRGRAEALLDWLGKQPADILLLTETSAGAGTDYLLGRFREAGYAVGSTPGGDRDRGAVLISKIGLLSESLPGCAEVSLPGRLAGAVIDSEPRIAVLGIYVPSRDRSLPKTVKKQTFISSLLAALEALPAQLKGRLIIGGDYNVIGRGHVPRHPGFLPFEYGLLDALEQRGFIDAHARRAPGVQEHSWIGRTGDGYRYDYFHVGRELDSLVAGCEYLHETRVRRLTDHAAVALSLNVAKLTRLDTLELPSVQAATLF